MGSRVRLNTWSELCILRPLISAANFLLHVHAYRGCFQTYPNSCSCSSCLAGGMYPVRYPCLCLVSCSVCVILCRVELLEEILCIYCSFLLFVCFVGTWLRTCTLLLLFVFEMTATSMQFYILDSFLNSAAEFKQTSFVFKKFVLDLRQKNFLYCWHFCLLP